MEGGREGGYWGFRGIDSAPSNDDDDNGDGVQGDTADDEKGNNHIVL